MCCTIHTHPNNSQGTIYCADWSKDGQRLVTGGADRQAIVWSASGADPLHRVPHADSVQAAVFAPTSTLLATVAGTELALTHPGKGTTGTKTKVNEIGALSGDDDHATFTSRQHPIRSTSAPHPQHNSQSTTQLSHSCPARGCVLHGAMMVDCLQ